MPENFPLQVSGFRVHDDDKDGNVSIGFTVDLELPTADALKLATKAAAFAGELAADLVARVFKR